MTWLKSRKQQERERENDRVRVGVSLSVCLHNFYGNIVTQLDFLPVEPWI